MASEPVGVGVPRAGGTKSERIDLRGSVQQKRLLEDAAAAADRTLTDFVLQSASVEARRILAERTQFALSREQWHAFTTALDLEPRYLPDLAAFLARPSVLDRE